VRSGKEIESFADTEFLGTTVGQPSCRKVLKGEPNAGKYRDLLIITPPGSGAGQNLADRHG
jgi:hypothetical protein